MLKVGEHQHIRYTKDSGETSERYIIPTHIPTRNIKALDVSEASPRERQLLMQQYNEYVAYVKSQCNTIFSFEDWVEHTGGEKFDLNWRTFKPNNVEEL